MDKKKGRALTKLFVAYGKKKDKSKENGSEREEMMREKKTNPKRSVVERSERKSVQFKSCLDFCSSFTA